MLQTFSIPICTDLFSASGASSRSAPRGPGPILLRRRLSQRSEGSRHNSRHHQYGIGTQPLGYSQCLDHNSLGLLLHLWVFGRQRIFPKKKPCGQTLKLSSKPCETASPMALTWASCFPGRVLPVSSRTSSMPWKPAPLASSMHFWIDQSAGMDQRLIPSSKRKPPLRIPT